MTKAAVIGAGRVGQALAGRLVHAGAGVTFGVRDPKAAAASLAGPAAEIPCRLVEESAHDATVLLVAVPAAAAVAALRGAGSLSGRIVVDCTNPVRWDEGPVWAPPAEGSVAQAIAVAFPAAAVIKGFNHFGAEIQANPALEGGPADAFFAGDDARAKATIIDLAGRMGFHAHDAGPLRNAALLENLAVLWIHLAFAGAGREFGFRMEPPG